MPEKKFNARCVCQTRLTQSVWPQLQQVFTCTKEIVNMHIYVLEGNYSWQWWPNKCFFFLNLSSKRFHSTCGGLFLTWHEQSPSDSPGPNLIKCPQITIRKAQIICDTRERKWPQGRWWQSLWNKKKKSLRCVVFWIVVSRLRAAFKFFERDFRTEEPDRSSNKI